MYRRCTSKLQLWSSGALSATPDAQAVLSPANNGAIAAAPPPSRRPLSRPSPSSPRPLHLPLLSPSLLQCLHSLLLTQPSQCLRRARVHQRLQRPQARQVAEVDHLQDQRRLEGNRRRGDVDGPGLQRLPRQAAQREEQGPPRQGGHWRPLCRLRCRVRARER